MGNSTSATISTESISEIISNSLSSQVTNISVSGSADTQINQTIDGSSTNCNNVAITDNSVQLYATTSVYKDGQIYQDALANITNDIVQQLTQTNSEIVSKGSTASLDTTIKGIVETNLTMEQMDIMNSNVNSNIVINQSCGGGSTGGTNYAYGTSSAISNNLFDSYMQSASVQQVSADISNTVNNSLDQENTSALAGIMSALLGIVLIVFIIIVIILAIAGVGYLLISTGGI